MRKTLAAAAVVLCFLAARATADWPQYRGPDQDGTSPEKGLLRSWPKGGPEVLWTVPLGVGYGGPAIRDGEVYILDRVDNTQDVLRCLDLDTGKELWRYAYDARGRLSHNGSRATPTVDEKYVYTIGPFGHIKCIDRTSHEVVWSKHLLSDFGGKRPRYGVAQSPALYGEAVIIAPLSDKAGVVALDKTTGKELWRSEPLGGLAYTSPRIARLGGVDQVLIISASRPPRSSGGRRGGRDRRSRADRRGPAGRDRNSRPRRGATTRPARSGAGAHTQAASQPKRQIPDWMTRVTNRVVGIAADDGRLLWSYDKWRCLNPIPDPTPVGDDRVFVTGGYFAGSVMLKITAEQDKFAVETIFKLPDYGAQIPNPLLHAGHLYMVCNGNMKKDGLVCIDLEGNVKWKTGRKPNLDRGHTLIADGLMYSIDGAKGIVRLIEPSPAGYKEISQVKLLSGSEIWAPMALADGKLLIRDQRQMKCLNLRPADRPE